MKYNSKALNAGQLTDDEKREIYQYFVENDPVITFLNRRRLSLIQHYLRTPLLSRNRIGRK